MQITRSSDDETLEDAKSSHANFLSQTVRALSGALQIEEEANVVHLIMQISAGERTKTETKELDNFALDDDLRRRRHRELREIERQTR